MNIILLNNSEYKLEISDLGIEIYPTKSIDLYSLFSIQELIISSSINDLYLSTQNFRMSIDGSVIGTYQQFIDKLTLLSKNEHETLKTLKHQEYEKYYFEVTKVESRSKFITYYKDNTKAIKIREEIINRDIDGKVSSIQTIQYDDSGSILSSVIETLNRESGGKIVSTTME